MYQFKIKIRKTDRDYSKYIRTKADWKCEMCGRDCSYDKSKLENSHYFGRARETTRFDDRNCHALCKPCHRKTHENKEYYSLWIKKKLGHTEFQRLALLSNQVGKRDDVMQNIINKQLLKELENGQ